MEEIVVRVPPGKVRITEGRCPRGCSLMDETKLLNSLPSIKVEISLAGKRAPMHLSALYGVYQFQTSLVLKDGDIVEVSCPQCGVSLSNPSSLCGLCQSPMFVIRLGEGGEVQACPKMGCHNHKLAVVDVGTELERLYDEDMKFLL